ALQDHPEERALPRLSRARRAPRAAPHPRHRAFVRPHLELLRTPDLGCLPGDLRQLCLLRGDPGLHGRGYDGPRDFGQEPQAPGPRALVYVPAHGRRARGLEGAAWRRERGRGGHVRGPPHPRAQARARRARRRDDLRDHLRDAGGDLPREPALPDPGPGAEPGGDGRLGLRPLPYVLRPHPRHPVLPLAIRHPSLPDRRPIWPGPHLPEEAVVAAPDGDARREGRPGAAKRGARPPRTAPLPSGRRREALRHRRALLGARRGLPFPYLRLPGRPDGRHRAPRRLRGRDHLRLPAPDPRRPGRRRGNHDRDPGPPRRGARGRDPRPRLPALQLLAPHPARRRPLPDPPYRLREVCSKGAREAGSSSQEKGLL
ncbi:MAG: hypothetical protein AVDCRST_MAG25-654, partial [uncultured Rubrobacteraceae bacterium]